MHRLLWIMALGLLLFSAGASTVQAQVSLDFQTGDSGSFTVTTASPTAGVASAVFSSSTGTGGGPNILNGIIDSSSTLPNGSPAPAGYWEINFGGAVSVDENGSVNENGNTVTLSIGTTPGGSNLLTGTLTLTDFATSGSTASFNDELAANLVVTSSGGAFAGQYPSGGAESAIYLVFSSGSGIQWNSFGSVASLGSGPLLTRDGVLIDPTPEPAAFLLFGTGLLALGGIIRRSTRT